MSRRSNGEGTIYKRKDGRWEAAAVLGGKRCRRVTRTRQEAHRWLNGALKAHEDGLPVIPRHETVEGFLAKWLPGRTNQIRPSTWTRYEQFIRLDIVPAIGKVKLAQLKPEHVQMVQDRMLGRGASPTSVHHAHAMLHRALKDAVRRGLVLRNVADLVDPPRDATKEMLTLTADQAEQFLAAAERTRLYALFALAVTTGMRQGELLALRWRDVDLNSATLSVVASLTWRNGRPYRAEPKTSRSRRRLALSSVAVAALRRHRAEQAMERLQAGTEWDDSHDSVFCGPDGVPLNPWAVRVAHLKVLNEGGLPRIRFHDLRHTAATLMLLRGVHVKVVSEMLGHATVAITLDTYSHVLPEMQAEAVRAMDRIFSSLSAGRPQ